MNTIGTMASTKQLNDFISNSALIGSCLRVIIGAIALFLLFKLINFLGKGLRKVLEKKKIDPTLVPMIVSIIVSIAKICVALAVLDFVGVKTTAFAAVMAAAALAIGMAFSGNLQNFAGGFLLVVLRPFNVDDVIEAQGFIGKVKRIAIFHTTLLTPDNKTIIIPNGPLSNGAITNFSTEELRRCDLTFGIGYNDDINQARDTILEVANQHDKVLQDPAPFVKVSELADSSVNFTVRLWLKGADYWDVFFYMNENVKAAFDAKNISIPYPQQDLHIHQQQK